MGMVHNRQDAEDLSQDVFIEELRHTDGRSLYEGSTDWNTTNLHDVMIVLTACITNTVTCNYTENPNGSGFANGKMQYRVSIGTKPTASVNPTVNPLSEKADVMSIQTVNDTLIVMRNGKPSFTGNCRTIQHLADNSPATMQILDELHGFTIEKLFGLDRYEINLVSKNDFAAYTKSDIKKEVAKNYKVYWDCFLTHHFPQGRDFGVPGVNGHHHKHLVWAEHNHTFGSYEWHQSGAGHQQRASYCEGEKWSCGFVIATIHIPSKSVSFEYVNTTNDMAVIAGEFLFREDSERVPVYAEAA